MGSTRAKQTETGGTARGPRRRRKPSRAAVARRAFELYQADRGGDQVAHWLQAERELSGG